MKSAKFKRTEHHDRLVVHQLSQSEHEDDFAEAVRAGLSERPKWIPPKFFYDARGSELFEEITRTPEYYPTRTEAAILQAYAAEILQAAGEDLELVELGSGSSTKTRLILAHLLRRQGSLEYTAIDISPSIVTENGLKLLKDFPGLRVKGLICDYHQAMEALRAEPGPPRLFLFLGSSLCNYTTADAARLLSVIAAAMAPHDRLLLGMDLKKDRAVLEAAYNDAAGVTAAFNLNVLSHINRVLDGGFDLGGFRHLAFYNEAMSRIEMHLESTRAQVVPIKALGATFSFQEGETIHTENSHKHDQASLQSLYALAGVRKAAGWRDEKGWFALHLLAPDNP